MVRLAHSAPQGDAPVDGPLRTRPVRTALFVMVALVNISIEYGVTIVQSARGPLEID